MEIVMRFIVLLVVLLAPTLSAQYWVGFENDINVVVVSLEIHDSQYVSTGNLLSTPLPQGGTHTHPSLSAGDYTITARTQDGYVYGMYVTVPGGVVGGIIANLSAFTTVLAPPPVAPEDKKQSKKEDGGCVAGTSGGYLWATLLGVVLFSVSLRRRSN